VNPAAKNPSGPPGPAALTPARTGKSALPRPDRKPGTRRPTPPSSVSGYALLSCCCSPGEPATAQLFNISQMKQ